jgi:hypothetical protein
LISIKDLAKPIAKFLFDINDALTNTGGDLAYEVPPKPPADLRTFAQDGDGTWSAACVVDV